jgi:P-type conjugative transfer protein TrbJ
MNNSMADWMVICSGFAMLNIIAVLPCFSLQEKCNEGAWKLLKEGQNTSTDAQKNANDSLLRGLSEHQNQIPLDAAHLQVLQQRTESAQGQMEALQYANQLAAYQANQLLQMRQMLIAQHNAANTLKSGRGRSKGHAAGCT